MTRELSFFAGVEHMMRMAVMGALGLVLAIGFPSAASGQLPGGPRFGEEMASVNLKLGLLAPQTTFTDPSFGESSFSNGFAAGIGLGVWPILDHRIGLRANLIRGRTDGENSTSEFAPIAMNDPTVYLYTLEAAARLPMGSGSPYVSVGYGGKLYSWKVTPHRLDRFGTWTAATGYEARPASLGPFGITAELRGYRGSFRAFGIDDGTWEPGPYGGRGGGVPNLDLLFTTGFALYF
jgi:hypothetical protein